MSSRAGNFGMSQVACSIRVLVLGYRVLPGGLGWGKDVGVEDVPSTPQRGYTELNAGRRRGGHGCGDQRDAGRAGLRLRAAGA